MNLIESVAGAIIELVVQKPIEGAWDKAQRNDRILSILKKVNLNPKSPPDDKFETLYAYTLVEWGAFKSEELVNLFRDEQTRRAFERAMQENKPEGWRDEADEIILAYREKGQYTLDYNPLRELEAFSEIFDRFVTYSRTPASARRDHTLDELRQQNAVILQRLDTLILPEDDAELLRPYLEMVQRRSSRLMLRPLDKAGKNRAEMQLGRLFINLNAGAASTPFRDVPDKQGEYRAAVAHIYHNPRLILLGDPGSGKTTVLRYVSLYLAEALLSDDADGLNQLQWEVTEPRQEREMDWHRREEELKELRHWETPPLIPILIELRDFVRPPFQPDDPQAVWRYVCRQLEAAEAAEAIPALKRAAQQGQVLFLFDGVDEVPIKQRPDVWRAIMALDETVFGGCRWVTTCRVLSFNPAELSTPYPPLQTVSKLTEPQIDAFITNWFELLAETGEDSSTEAKDKTNQLQRALRRQKLLSLAENPMLLTIMALVQTYYGTLPQERARLYQASVETLLLRWQRHKEGGADTNTLSELPDLLTQLEAKQEDLERLLWEIGWAAHSESVRRQDDADITEAEVMKIAKKHLGGYEEAGKFVTYTEERAHLLIGKGGKEEKHYSFPHRTFQEYLAACHLASQRRFGRKARKLAVTDDIWREVLNLAVGTLVFNQNNREKALDGIEDVIPKSLPEAADDMGWRQVWLAAEMLAVVGRETAERDEVGQEILPRIRRQLTVLVETGRLPPRQRAEAGDVLGRLGDERDGVGVREPALIEISDGLTFGMGQDNEPVTIPAPYKIAKYPVTNAQFRFFVDDDGYKAKWQHCWTPEGWDYKESGNWIEPRLWNDSQFNLPNQPVVAISWYEAVAYANWLAAVTGDDYRLPTEAEWERAARHTDNRIYPWGNKWEDGIVNSKEAGIGRLTAVGIFPDGATPKGILDMSGNVWEWQQTRWRDEKGDDYSPVWADDGRENLAGDWNIYRVLKGGSFWNDKDVVPAAARNSNLPYHRITPPGVCG